MKLLSLKAENFCCFEKIECDLLLNGLVWVTGNNKDSKSASNNGCGKTTLFKSIIWCLYGSVLVGNSGDGIIREGCKEASVELCIKSGGTEYKIWRKRKKGQPFLKLFVGDKDLNLSKTEIQNYIEKLVGLDYESFKNTISYGQGDSFRFANLSTRDSVRKSILHSILNLDIFEKCYKIVNSKRQEKIRELYIAEQRVEKFDELIRETDLSTLKTEMISFESDREKQIRKLNTSLKTYNDDKNNLKKDKEEDIKISIRKAKESIERIKKTLEDYDIDEINNNIKNKKRNLRKIRTIVDDLEKQKIVFETSKKQLSARLEELGSNECPLCGTDSNSDSVVNTKEKLGFEINSYEIEIDKFEKLIEKSVSGKIDIEHEISNLLEKISNIDDLKYRLNDLEKDMKHNKEYLKYEKTRFDNEKKHAEYRIQDTKEKIDDIKNQKNPYLNIVKKALKDVKRYRVEKRSANKSRKGLEKNIEMLEFWKEGFSNRGLRSMILDGVMGILTDRTNHYLSILADGDITAEFATKRELKTNRELKDEISISWNIEGGANHQPSGGQMKKIEIACDLALMDLASYNKQIPDILFLDEILDGLDEQGVKRVLLLLRELKKTRSTIFVISHNSSMSEDFDRVIKITKKNGISKLEVA
jgi:DNA repair exonuclease SbcCD ATPase subunit